LAVYNKILLNVYVAAEVVKITAFNI
jgi:hypothetical protein